MLIIKAILDEYFIVFAAIILSTQHKGKKPTRKGKNKMKNLLFSALTILFATLIIGIIPTESEGAIYEDTVRLHILANSDSKEDQELKLYLRDEIINEFGCELSIFESADSAKEELKRKLGEIEEFAGERIRKAGYSYSVRAELCEEWYETRDYGEFSLPKGEYSSLIIKIGEGAGENWWCVMFPPLCLDASTSDKGYTASESMLISKKYSIKFKTLELISEISRKRR